MFLDKINFSLMLSGSSSVSWINLISIHTLFHFFFFYRPSLESVFSPCMLSRVRKTFLRKLLILAGCSSQSPIYSSYLPCEVSANHQAMAIACVKVSRMRNQWAVLCLFSSGVSAIFNRIESQCSVERGAWNHTAWTEISARPLIQTRPSGHHSIFALPWKR